MQHVVAEVVARSGGHDLDVWAKEVDANAKLGSISVENHRGEMLIGSEGQQRETANSACLREFLIVNDLCAPQTFLRGGSGATWAGAGSNRTRIDYILIPAGGPASLDWCRVGYSQGQQLQLADTRQWRDHAPVIFCLWYRDFHTDPAKRPFQLGRVATDILLHSDELKTELRDLANAEYTKKEDAFPEFDAQHDPDAMWRFANDIIRMQQRIWPLICRSVSIVGTAPPSARHKVILHSIAL